MCRLGTCVCCLFNRLFCFLQAARLLRFIKRFSSFGDTLARGFHHLLGTTIMFMLLVLAYAQLGYLVSRLFSARRSRRRTRFLPLISCFLYSEVWNECTASSGNLRKLPEQPVFDVPCLPWSFGHKILLRRLPGVYHRVLPQLLSGNFYHFLQVEIISLCFKMNFFCIKTLILSSSSRHFLDSNLCALLCRL